MSIKVEKYCGAGDWFGATSESNVICTSRIPASFIHSAKAGRSPISPIPHDLGPRREKSGIVTPAMRRAEGCGERGGGAAAIARIVDRFRALFL